MRELPLPAPNLLLLISLHQFFCVHQVYSNTGSSPHAADLHIAVAASTGGSMAAATTSIDGLLSLQSLDDKVRAT